MTLRRMLEAWYARLPDWLDGAALAAGARFRAVTLREVRMERWTAADGGATVVTYGRTPSVDYFLDDLLGNGARRLTSGTVPLDDVLPDADADLTICRGPRVRLAHRLGGGWHAVPEAVNVAVRTDGARQGRPPWHNPSTSNNIARVRENALEAEATHDPSELDLFYERFYVPYLRRRFGDQATLRSRHRLLRWFRSGGLIWIVQGDRRLAGELYSVEGNMAHSRAIAANPEIPEALDLGAMAAGYLFLFELARARGIRAVDMGPSRPSLADGVLQHKLRWGGALRPEPTPPSDLYLHWKTMGGAALNLLVKNPIVERDGDALAGRVAMPPGAHPEKTRSRLNRMAAPGLSRLRVHADASSRCEQAEAGGVPIEWIPLGAGT